MSRRSFRGSSGAMAILTLAVGCSRSRTEARAEEAIPSGTVGTLDALAPVASPHAAAAWNGVYEASAGELYIPLEWKDVHWKVKEIDAGIGAGTIAIRVDPATGRVLGALEGPLGPATIDGLVADGKLTASIARRDPSDEGFIGTVIATIANDRVDGKIWVSLASANAIRWATFTMAPESAPRASR